MKYIGRCRTLPLHPHQLDVPVITHIPIGPAVLPHHVPVTEGLPSSLAGPPCTGSQTLIRLLSPHLVY